MLRPAVAKHDRLSLVFSACFEDFEFHTVDRNKGGLRKIGWFEHRVFLIVFADDRAPAHP
ncbi:hypothetical protein GCM10023096_66160 [Nonomuraea ferruginea]